MATVSAKQVLSNLYGLMMEINLHRTDEEVLDELRQRPDASIEAHLSRIKQLSTKLKAAENRSRFKTALDQIKLLKEKGINELKQLIQPSEEAELIPLFHKFQELTEKDAEAILEDKALLQLMKILKERINEDKHD